MVQEIRTQNLGDDEDPLRMRYLLEHVLGEQSRHRYQALGHSIVWKFLRHFWWCRGRGETVGQVFWATKAEAVVVGLRSDAEKGSVPTQ